MFGDLSRGTASLIVSIGGSNPLVTHISSGATDLGGDCADARADSPRMAARYCTARPGGPREDDWFNSGWCCGTASRPAVSADRSRSSAGSAAMQKLAVLLRPVGSVTSTGNWTRSISDRGPSPTRPGPLGSRARANSSVSPRSTTASAATGSQSLAKDRQRCLRHEEGESRRSAVAGS